MRLYLPGSVNRTVILTLIFLVKIKNQLQFYFVKYYFGVDIFTRTFRTLMMSSFVLGKGRRNRETQKPGTQLVNYIKKENFYCL